MTSSKKTTRHWSEWQDSNLRPLAPHASTLANCATPRCYFIAIIMNNVKNSQIYLSETDAKIQKKLRVIKNSWFKFMLVTLDVAELMKHTNPP